MKYIINSPRVGTVGKPYEPAEWVNLEALVRGGFIIPADSVKPAPKSAKNKTSKSRPDSDKTSEE